MSKRQALAAIMALALAISSLLAHADTATTYDTKNIDAMLCPNANIWGASLFKNICWSQLYPVRLAGIDLFGNIAPDDANTNPLCACQGDISKGKLPMVGFTSGMWRPVRIVEAVRKPWCLPSMGGIKLPSLSTNGDVNLTGGLTSSDIAATMTGFYNINYYYADFLSMLNLLNAPLCNPGGVVDFDFAQTSSFYPQWSDEKLAAVLNPELSVLATIGLSLVQPVDCLTTTARDHPMDDMILTAGCWGQMVPYAGVVRPPTSIPEMWLLTSSRFLAMLSRLGMVKRTVGADTVCDAPSMYIMKKSQYRFQALWPVPQAKGSSDQPAPTSDGSNAGQQVPEVDLNQIGDKCTTSIGDTTLRNMEFRSRPATGEDGIFLLWQWVDCCVGVTPGS